MVLAGCLMLVTSCGAAPVSFTATINQDESGAGGSYAPATVRVPEGSTVTWVERDPQRLHTVTADDHSFGSNFLRPGQSYTVRFNSAGTYRYHCAIHPQMVGEVVVG